MLIAPPRLFAPFCRVPVPVSPSVMLRPSGMPARSMSCERRALSRIQEEVMLPEIDTRCASDVAVSTYVRKTGIDGPYWR